MRVQGRGTFRQYEKQIEWEKTSQRTGAYKTFKHGVKSNWPQLNDLCSNTGLIPVQKFQFGFLSINQKRKRKVREMQKLITNFNIKAEEIGFIRC